MSEQLNVNGGISSRDIVPTPYYVCRNEGLVRVRNALGLVGAILFSNKTADVHIRMSGFLTLFSLMNTEELTLSSNQEIFRSHGYDLQSVYINCLQDLFNRVVFTHYETRFVFKNLLKARDTDSRWHSRPCVHLKGDWHTQLKNIPALDYPFEYTIAFCGIYYLFALKRLEKSYLHQDVISTIDTFSDSLRLNTRFPIFTLLASEETYAQFQDTLHKMFSVRKYVFLIIRDMHHETIGKWSVMCGDLLQSLKYTDMETLRLINRCIFVDNPELISNSVFQSEISSLCSSLAFTQQQMIDTADLPYIKLLYDSSVTGHFSTNRYKNLAYLAISLRFGYIPENKSIWKYAETCDRTELDQLAIEIALKTKPSKPEDVFLRNQGCLARFKDLLDALADPFTGQDISEIMTEAPSDQRTNISSSNYSTTNWTHLEDLPNMVQKFDQVTSLDVPQKYVTRGRLQYSLTPTPYYICRKEELVNIQNALGLVGAIFFSDESKHDYFRMSGFLTLLSLMSPKELKLSSNLEIFRSYGYDPQPIEVNRLQELYNRISFTHSKTKLAFKRLLNTEDVHHNCVCVHLSGNWHLELRNILSLDYPFSYTIAICGMYYLFAMRNFQKDQNMLSIWGIFANHLGLGDEIPNFFLLPSKEAWANFHSSMFRMFNIRKLVFQIIRVTHSKVIGRWPKMCDVLLELLKYTEMFTVRLINRCIFVDNSHLITNPMLQTDIEALCSSLVNVQKRKIDNIDLPYIKLLYYSLATDDFATSRYKYLAYLAAKINFGNVPKRTAVSRNLEEYERTMLDWLAKDASKNKTKKSEDASSLGSLAEFKELLDILADPFTGETRK